MAKNVARVSVELKQKHANPSEIDKARAFKNMLTAFKRQCSDYGIAALYKQHEKFEKPSEKKHRKKREKELERSKKKRAANPRSNKR